MVPVAGPWGARGTGAKAGPASRSVKGGASAAAAAAQLGGDCGLEIVRRHVLEAGALGGQLLAVSKYSKNPEIAADLVMSLTSAEEQKRRAIVGSFNPTIPALFKDPEIQKAAPFIGELFEVFANAVARPATITGQHYNKVSSEFFNTVHQVLSGRAEPERALAGLERDLKRIKRGGWKE